MEGFKLFVEQNSTKLLIALTIAFVVLLVYCFMYKKETLLVSHPSFEYPEPLGYNNIVQYRFLSDGAKKYQKCLTDAVNRHLVNEGKLDYIPDSADVIGCLTKYGRYGRQYN